MRVDAGNPLGLLAYCERVWGQTCAAPISLPALTGSQDLTAANGTAEIFLPGHKAQPVPARSLEEGSMTQHQGLPVAGYTAQSDEKVRLVYDFKMHEEVILRVLDGMRDDDTIDQRWLAIGRTDLQKAFMAINRSVFAPQRVRLDGDPE